MISRDTKLSIQSIPIANLIVEECKPRYLTMVTLYVDKLRSCPHDEAGLLRVVPSTAHPGMYVIEDGHHKYCAYIIAGRKDALCIIVERASV